MTKATDQVRHFLHKNAHLIKALADGVINRRALSLLIIRRGQVDASLDAVMTAVRRFEDDFSATMPKQKAVSQVIKDSRISTKSRLVMIEVQRHFRILSQVIPDILKLIRVSKGEVLRLVEGRQTIIFVVDYFKKDEVLGVIPKEELLEVRENLGEINIMLSEDCLDQPGLFAPIINEFAINDINIELFVGTYPELIVIINEKDISKSHDAMLRFFYGK